MAVLDFSTSEIQVSLYENEEFDLATPAIVFNCEQYPQEIGKTTLDKRESSLLTGQYGSIRVKGKVIVMSLPKEPSALENYPQRDALMENWTQVYDIFALEHLKQTQLYRSDKQRAGDVAFNLWFAADGTDCGIHNEHDFLEVHTQVWGTGHMQKFHENDASTKYEDIFMTPGYTHKPFCGEHDHNYPHHRYFADTDCIWLAVEYYS